VTDAGEGRARLVSCYQPVLTGTMALLAQTIAEARGSTTPRKIEVVVPSE
jgi:hypothetical protein